MPKCDFNKVALQFFEITLRHGCFPVNLLHIFRTLFPKNTPGRLLLLLKNKRRPTSYLMTDQHSIANENQEKFVL